MEIGILQGMGSRVGPRRVMDSGQFSIRGFESYIFQAKSRFSWDGTVMRIRIKVKFRKFENIFFFSKLSNYIDKSLELAKIHLSAPLTRHSPLGRPKVVGFQDDVPHLGGTVAPQ